MTLLRIFKIGGKVVEDHQALQSFTRDFATIKGPKMLVHGGGKSVSAMSQRLNIDVKMIHGRRITDGDTLEVVKMMLAGVANKNVVAMLQGFGCNALGMTGADGNTILAERRPVVNGIDYGYVGDVKRVANKSIRQLIDHGFVPVFAAMTHDGMGHMLNTNADTIASSLAVAMADIFEVELIYCFELNGVLTDVSDPESVVRVIDQSVYRDMKVARTISEGMIPKIDNAFDALQAGVKLVHIGAAKHINHLVDNSADFGTKIML